MLASLRHFFLQRAQTERTYWIAYSGGLDSQVLLHLCRRVREDYPLRLRAIHINHHLSPQAAAWSAHCAKTCADWEIDFCEKNINVVMQPGDSLEECAREARYAMFATVMQADDMLLTAHQQDDQAETVLLQLVRGAGPKGLAAMPLLKPFAAGWHGRPLLAFSRAMLQAYADEAELTWVEDESNRNDKFTRNFIRHDILPRLSLRWPTVGQALARSARHCAESQVILEDVALSILDNMRGSTEDTLSVTKLLSLDQPRLHLVMRTWISSRGYALPDTVKLNLLRQEVLLARPERMPCLTWGQVSVRRYRDDLYLLAQPTPRQAKRGLAWNVHEPLVLPGIGVVSASLMPGKGLRLTEEPVSVRFRQGGESVRLGRRGWHTLKNLYQEWGVPPWERDDVPLLFVGDVCRGVLGYGTAEDADIKSEEMGFVPHLTRD